MPSGAASVNFHFQETTAPSSTDGPTGLAEGLMAQVGPLLRACMSDETYVTMCQVYKKAVVKEPPAAASIADGQGLVAGPALPSQFGAKLGLAQTFFPSVSNGMVWIPGIPEGQVNISLLLTAFLDGPILALADQLLLDVTEPAAGDGRWRLVVVSRKFLLANPGDWVGASADVTAINRHPIIGRQRRRRTKVQGGAA